MLASALAGRPVKLEEPTAAPANDTLAGAQKPAKGRKGGPPPKAEASLGGLLEGLFGN